MAGASIIAALGGLFAALGSGALFAIALGEFAQRPAHASIMFLAGVGCALGAFSLLREVRSWGS